MMKLKIDTKKADLVFDKGRNLFRSSSATLSDVAKIVEMLDRMRMLDNLCYEKV